MLIILEGPDGAGKTWLKEALAKRHGVKTRMMQVTELNGEPMIDLEWSLRDYPRGDLSTLWICDSWHVGVSLYGRLYRGRSVLTAPAAKHVELYLEALGALKVIVTDSVGMIERRLQDRGNRIVQPQHVGLVWDAYNDWAADNKWLVVESTKIRAKTLLNMAQRTQVDAMHLVSLSSYIGNLHPRVLVLTSNRSWNVNSPKYQAALTPTLAVPSHHAIMERLMHYQNFGVLSQDADQIRDAWPIFGEPEVVVTDQHALAACAIAGIPATPFQRSQKILETAGA